MTVPDGAHIACPRCDSPISLTHFVDDDDEVGVSNATCLSCGERVTVVEPRGAGDR